MRTLFTLLLLSLLCTCVRAQKTSSATMVVSLNPDVILLHISSSSGYEEIGYISPELRQLYPQDYPGFRVLPRRSEYDLTIVHRHLDSLAAKGWTLESSNFGTAVGAPEFQPVDRQRLYYHFSIPPQQEPKTQDPDQFTLLRNAEVSSLVRNQMRGRILKMNDGPVVLLIEERFGSGWRELYRLDDEGAVAGDQAERITGFSISSNQLVLKYELANGTYSYQFFFDGLSYALRLVNFESSSLCGVHKYRLELKAQGGSQIQFVQRGTPCEGDEQPRVGTRKVIARPADLRSFFAGSYRLKLEKAGLSLLY